MNKRRMFMLLGLVAAVLTVGLLQPATVSATEIQTRYCQGCQQDIALEEWIALGGEQTETLALEAGEHYYLTEAVTGAPEGGVLLSGAGCLDLNGFDITAGSDCIAISCAAGTTNLMGTGTVTGSCTTSETGATIHTATSAVVHLYGGTITKSGNNSAIYIGKNSKVHLYDGATIDTVGTFSTYPTAVLMRQTGSLFHMHGGIINGGTTTGNGGAIRVSAGSMIMDNGTINGGTASRGGAIAVNKDVSSKATLTVNGGTITGGTAVQTNGGGNLYVNYVSITINGGLITKGTATDASYGGGNLGARLGTYVINGGTISEGSTAGSKGGGNIFLSGSTLTMNGGTITGGTSSCSTTMSGGGNVFLYSSSTFTQNDGVITLGTSASSYGGGNIYLDDSTYNMYDGEITYGSATHTSCRGGGNIYVQSDDCLVNIVGGTVRYGWLANGYGNNIHQRYGKCYLGKDAYLGSKGTGTQGDMSLYLYSGTLESYATFTGGLKVREGYAYLKDGQYYSFYYEGSKTCQITGGKFRINYSEFVPEGYQWITVATTGDYKYTVLPDGGTTDMVLVDYAGNETFTYQAVTLFDLDTYSHIKLYNDVEINAAAEKELWVDLNGKNLTVTGEGKLNAFDTANDTYDASACGTITNNGAVEITKDVRAHSGCRYVAVPDGTATTMHRLDVRLTSVSLRPAATGIYYKAAYYCDELLTSKVSKYGMVLSVNNMPGEDFLTETEDINRYTVATAPFQSGIVATSGSVFGIMKADRTAELNATYGDVTVYANPYILFDFGAQMLCVGDSQNAGKQKTDADFTGTAYSLHDVMDALDAGYYSYSVDVRKRLDAFFYTWYEKGMDWGFENIGQSYTSELMLTDGQGYCPACKAMVSWTALDQETYATVPYGTAADGDHVYLTEDILYTGADGNAFLLAPATAGNTACFHLNGHSLTATQDRTLYGNPGVLNVMGNGTVAGRANSAGYGSTVQTNTTSSKGVVNLYSGTYRQAETAGTGTYVISIRASGGTVKVYQDAHIEANISGKAAWLGTSTSTHSVLGLYDTTVDGSIYLSGSKSTKTSKLVLDNATVNGTIDANGVNTIVLGGTPKAELLDMEADTLVTVETLLSDTQIPIRANGCFTKLLTDAESYVSCFRATETGKRILAENNTLVCRMDYLAGLELDENHAGYCPVCQKSVTWTALEDAAAPVQLTDGQHLYLTQPLTYEAAEAAFITAPATQDQSACLHLNGYDLTATQNQAVYSSCGILNVMGSGTVTGYTDSDDRGAAVTVDAAAANAAVNLYGGTYQKYTGSNASAAATGICSTGGTLNLYEDAVVACTDDNAIYVGTAGNFDAVLGLYDAAVEGAVVLSTPVANTSVVTVKDATITGAFHVASGTDVTLTGRPKISNLTVAAEALVTLGELIDGAQIGVSAEGIFTVANSSARLLEGYFTAATDGYWIVVQEDSLSCLEKETLPNGRKVMVVGNSMTYYSKYVIDKGHVLPLDTRLDDQGYLYQVCRANGLDVTVTNFTFGNHTLKDFYSGSCKADRGHNGHNHLEDLTDRNYDYVIMQEGSEAASLENIMAECQPLMDIFLEGNPNTKFVFLVQHTTHMEDNAWRSSIKELEENGIIVVDWGAMIADLINGTVTPPGASETYHKFSFIVNKSAADGRHPNILAGYLAAQMTYCAITGESAVGKDYSFWNDTTANSAFKLSSYKSTYYSYDKTVPSNTNFETIFKTPAEMTGLQQLIDLYLEEKSYREY